MEGQNGHRRSNKLGDTFRGRTPSTRQGDQEMSPAVSPKLFRASKCGEVVNNKNGKYCFVSIIPGS